jgi:broad specificity phosphatase PhoE
MTTFYLVRHAQSESNHQGYIAGHTDVNLTTYGKAEASIRAREFKNTPFDLVFSSDLIRARHTAEIIAFQRNLVVKTTHLLRERNYGDFEGKKTKKVLEKIKQDLKKFWQLELKASRNKRLNEAMETNEEIVARMLSFLRETAITYPDKSILVVSHCDILLTFLAHIGYIRPDEILEFTNTGYFKLSSDGKEFSVQETKGLSLKKESR